MISKVEVEPDVTSKYCSGMVSFGLVWDFLAIFIMLWGVVDPIHLTFDKFFLIFLFGLGIHGGLTPLMRKIGFALFNVNFLLFFYFTNFNVKFLKKLSYKNAIKKSETSFFKIVYHIKDQKI